MRRSAHTREGRTWRIKTTTGIDLSTVQAVYGGPETAAAEDTGRFARHVGLYLQMTDMQLTSGALRIIGYDMDMMQALAGEMQFVQQLAHAGKVAQGVFVARRKERRPKEEKSNERTLWETGAEEAAVRGRISVRIDDAEPVQ